jgi:basic membrane protein A and related proteins
MKRFRLVRVFLAALVLFIIASGCLPKPADCKQPNVFCVGLVTDIGGHNDRSFNQAAWDGLQQAKRAGVITWLASIDTVDARDYEENIRVFGEAGYDVIVTVGSAMADATRIESGSYPGTYFIGVDQDQSANQNFTPTLTGLAFPEDQIGFLAGAFAALMSKTGKIAAVCASDALPSIKLYGDGFLAGAANIGPDVIATVIYHNEVGLDKTFIDPEWGAAQANALVDSGTDIVFGVGGETASNAIIAAVSRGAFAIGADTDQYFALPVAAPHLYLSVLKMIAPAVTELVQTARDAQAGNSVFPTGNFRGKVGLSSYHDMDSSIPDEIKARMAELDQGLQTGQFQTGVTSTTP